MRIISEWLSTAGTTLLGITHKETRPRPPLTAAFKNKQRAGGGRVLRLVHPLQKQPTKPEIMIDEFREALAKDPENPFLQGHLSALENMPNCRNCEHCGGDARNHPRSGTPLIRCNHPSLDDEEPEEHEIDPTFGEMCADYSRMNAKSEP